MMTLREAVRFSFLLVYANVVSNFAVSPILFADDACMDEAGNEGSTGEKIIGIAILSLWKEKQSQNRIEKSIFL